MDSDQNTNTIILTEPMANVSLYEGDTLDLRCEITGDPLPKYTWYRGGVRVDRRQRSSVKILLWGSRLKITSATMNDQGLYNCSGRNPGGSVSTQAFVTVNPGPNPHRPLSKPSHHPSHHQGDSSLDEDLLPIFPLDSPDGGLDEGDEHLGMCQPYVGKVCSRFLENRDVFVFDMSHQEMTEEWLGDILSRLTSSKDISSNCKPPLHASICLFSFPSCHHDANRRDRMEESNSRKLCRDECEAVKKVHCYQEFNMKLGWSYSSGAKQMLTEVNRRDGLNKVLNVTDCRLLHRTSDRRHCNSAGIPLSPYNQDESCYHGDGSRYRGTVGTSISEKECLGWGVAGSKLEPTPSGFVLMTHNLCRNVNGTMTTPWCYVMRGGVVVKEACHVLPCETPEDTRHTGVLLGVPCVLLIVLLVTIILVAKLKKNKAKKKQVSEAQSNKALLERQSLTSKRPLPFISPAHVTLTFELFEGRFGKVYKGEVLSPTNPKPLPVILNTVESSLNVNSQTDFWSQLERLCDLQHANITCIIGANKTSPPCFAVFEGSAYGSLNEYLRTNSHLVDSQCLDVSSIIRTSILPPPVLVSVAIQVANAVEFLHARGHAHAHLNTLNVLVCENGLVKVSLVTPSQGLYYSKVNTKVILVRWASPEVISGQPPSEKSDIWSLGVLLWEIYSCADVPYKSLTDLEVVEMVKCLRILPCPLQCPSPLYSLMVQCWHKTPSSRPAASEVHASLRGAWNDLTNAGSVTQSSGSEKSHHTLEQYKFAYDCQPLMPLPNMTHCPSPHLPPLFPYQPLINSNFSQNTSNNHLRTQSSTTSHQSTPSSSTANFKEIARCDDVPKLYGFLNKEHYHEQII